MKNTTMSDIYYVCWKGSDPFEEDLCVATVEHGVTLDGKLLAAIFSAAGKLSRKVILQPGIPFEPTDSFDFGSELFEAGEPKRYIDLSGISECATKSLVVVTACPSLATVGFKYGDRPIEVCRVPPVSLNESLRGYISQGKGCDHERHGRKNYIALQHMCRYEVGCGEVVKASLGGFYIAPGMAVHPVMAPIHP